MRSETSEWRGPLLDRGAAAVLGNTWEPYLALTCHLDVFLDRLLKGYTLAEAAWMGTPALSWMTLVLGVLTASPVIWPAILVVPFWKWLVVRCTEMTLTNQRLKIRSGVFSRKTNELELYRVKDTTLDEPFILRLVSLVCRGGSLVWLAQLFQNFLQ